MSELKRKITSVLAVHGDLLSDDATLFANDNGQLVQVPLSSLVIDEDIDISLDVADDEDVEALLDALDMTGEESETNE